MENTMKALSAGKRVIAVVAPTAFSGAFQTDMTKKAVAALYKIGFSKVLDMRFGIAARARAEGDIFVERLLENQNLPMLLPDNQKSEQFCLEEFPQFAANITTSAHAESLMAKIEKVVGENVYVVSVVGEKREGIPLPDGVDAVLDRKELLHLMQKYGYENLENLEDASFAPMYGTPVKITGERMEEVLHAACGLYDVTAEKEERTEYKAMKDGRHLNAVTVYGYEAAHGVLESVQDGTAKFDIIEIMENPKA